MEATKKRSFPLSKVYGLLEPGPVVMVATVREGKPNIMTMSWHTMIEFTPPLVGCVVSNRNYSFDSLVETGECTINIPLAGLARAAVGCGNSSGRKVDKFAKFRLTPVASSVVKPPLIGECWASLECRVVDTSLVEQYGFFILETVKAWIDPTVKEPKTFHHRGRGVFAFDGRTTTIPSRMK